MYKKTFIVIWFYNSNEYAQRFVDHYKNLEKDGWFLKVFTHLPLKKQTNVDIIPMGIDDYKELIRNKLNIFFIFLTSLRLYED